MRPRVPATMTRGGGSLEVRNFYYGFFFMSLGSSHVLRRLCHPNFFRAKQGYRIKRTARITGTLGVFDSVVHPGRVLLKRHVAEYQPVRWSQGATQKHSLRRHGLH